MGRWAQKVSGTGAAFPYPDRGISPARCLVCALREGGQVGLTIMRWWLRSLFVGAAVGLAVGFVVGGTLGRVFMRLLFLAHEDTLGFETAMGAIVGDFTAGGTTFIFIFGGAMGLVLGLG